MMLDISRFNDKIILVVFRVIRKYMLYRELLLVYFVLSFKVFFLFLRFFGYILR